jgi:hypothetical protein
MAKKQKGKPPKKITTSAQVLTPPPNPPVPPTMFGTNSSGCWRMVVRAWRALLIGSTIIGLLILLQLMPRLTPNASLPTDTVDELSSSRFTITNDGDMRVTDVKATCFMWRVQYGKGVITINSGRYVIVSPPQNTLSVSEGITVPCTQGAPIESTLGPQPVTQADIGIVIDYRPWPLVFLRSRRIFRFVARFDEKGNIVAWDKQPAYIMEKDFDNAIKGWESRGQKF